LTIPITMVYDSDYDYKKFVIVIIMAINEIILYTSITILETTIQRRKIR